jgi:hypothetical protein
MLLVNVRRFVLVVVAADAVNFVVATGSMRHMCATPHNGVRQCRGGGDDDDEAVHGLGVQRSRDSWGGSIGTGYTSVYTIYSTALIA